MSLEFSEKALKQLDKLPNDIKVRIIKKMRFFVQQKNPLRFAKPLTDPRLGNYRYRIGDYRVSFDVIKKTIFILTIKHRSEAYE